MNIVEFQQFFLTCAAAGQNVGLIGPPGVGKTEVIKALCSTLTAADIFKDSAEPGDENRPVTVISHALTTKESVDVSGLLGEVDGRTVWFPPAFIPSQYPIVDPVTGEERMVDEPAIIIMDEFPQAELPTQKAYQKLIDRDLTGIRVSERCLFVIMGNGVQDNCGVSEVPQHIRNRFMWFHLEPDADLWREWADNQPGLCQSIRSFIGFKPEMISTFAPDSADFSYATARSITKVARICNSENRGMWTELATAGCGETWSSEWAQYRAYEGRCPPLEEILKNPGTVKFEDAHGVLWAMTDSLIYHVRQHPEDITRVAVTIARRLFDETQFRELAVRFVRELGQLDLTVFGDPQLASVADEIDHLTR